MISLILLILLINYRFRSIYSSHNLKLSFENIEKTKKEEEASKKQEAGETDSFVIPLRVSRQRTITTNTLMIDLNFQINWSDLIENLDKSMPKSHQTRLKAFPFVDPQIRLASGIRNDDPQTVKVAIDEGANFLKMDCDAKIKTTDYRPIEYAVTEGKIRSLRVMLSSIAGVPRHSIDTFLGGLLIKAVQSGQLGSIRILIREFNAPYIKNSYLLQQAVMHQASTEIIELLMKTFKTNPELFRLFGKYNDHLLHLSIRFNNFEAFSYFYDNPKIDKNIKNCNFMTPIELLASLPLKSTFMKKLVDKYPDFATSWTDEEGSNLLHHAVQKNDIYFIRMLVEELDFPIDIINNDKQTAVLLSYLVGKREIALYLVHKGADLFIKDCFDANILTISSESKDIKFFKSCLEAFDFNGREIELLDLHQYLTKLEKQDALRVFDELLTKLN